MKKIMMVMVVLGMLLTTGCQNNKNDSTREQISDAISEVKNSDFTQDDLDAIEVSVSEYETHAVGITDLMSKVVAKLKTNEITITYALECVEDVLNNETRVLESFNNVPLTTDQSKRVSSTASKTSKSYEEVLTQIEKMNK